METRKISDLRRSAFVFLILVALTAVEFMIALSEAATGLLILIALIKATAVIIYFMHIGRLFVNDEEVPYER